jgi:hypothetical protein
MRRQATPSIGQLKQFRRIGNFPSQAPSSADAFDGSMTETAFAFRDTWFNLVTWFLLLFASNMSSTE